MEGTSNIWLRGQESHLRPLGYEPSRLLLTYPASFLIFALKISL
jgi:hypothetical protein